MFSTIIQNFSDVVALVLLFGVTIFVHELGHFLVALKCGMQVDTFSLGFGPAIWKKTIRGITYKIAWFPIGGYVALPQLDPSGMDSIQGSGDGKPGKRSLPPIPAWKKILVSFSGAGGNVVFAFILAWIIFLSPEGEVDQPNTGTLIGYVDTNSPAYHQGVRVGDEILSVNGEAVKTWNDFILLCAFGADNAEGIVLALNSENAAKEVTVPTTNTEVDMPMVEGIGRSMLCVVDDVVPGGSAEAAGIEPGDIIKEFNGTKVSGTEHFVNLVKERPDVSTRILIERGGTLREMDVTPRYNEEAGRALVGVSVSSGMQNGAMQWMQYRRPLDQIKGDASGIVRILRALVTPREARQAAKGLGGPIMIFTALWMSIKISFLNAIGFIRFLNVNLAILNLLPIPVLDGGHIIFSLWEGITRRKISARLVNALVNVFMVLLLGVFILLSCRDVIRIPSLLKAFRARTEIAAEDPVGEPENADHEATQDTGTPDR